MTHNQINEIVLDRFPEVKSMRGEEGIFEIELNEDITKDPKITAAFVGELNDLLAPYLNNVEGTPYHFYVQRGGTVVNYLFYNDDDKNHMVQVQMNGNPVHLNLVDIMGNTNTYCIFNDKFEILGTIFLNVEDGDGNYRDTWTLYDKDLESLMPEIIMKGRENGIR